MFARKIRLSILYDILPIGADTPFIFHKFFRHSIRNLRQEQHAHSKSKLVFAFSFQMQGSDLKTGA